MDAQNDIGDAKILVPSSIAPGSVVHVRALISHPMHTGLFRDAQGNPIAAYFVKEMVAKYGDAEVARFEWTSGMSRDPFVTFPLRATRAAPLTITWKDNNGGVFTQSVAITLTA